MNLHRLAANIDYHQRVADAATDPVLAMKHYQAARLLHNIYRPAATAHAQRLILTESLNAISRNSDQRRKPV